MLTGKKVIIFDMDGTLIDSVGIWNKVDRTLISRLGKEQVSEDEIQRTRDEKLRAFSKEEKPYHAYCAYLSERYQFGLTAEETRRTRYEIATELLIKEIDYKPYADKVIWKLKKENYMLVIASTTRRQNMDIYINQNANIREKAAIDECFSLIYTHEDVKEIKPNPEIYFKVLETLQVDAKECMIFEDSLIGVEAATRAGIEVVAVYDKYSDADWDEICRRADYHLMSFEEMI